MKMRASVAILACSLASASAFFVLNTGHCPKVRTKPNFELSKYLGLWFSYENFVVPYQIGLSCIAALYSKDGWNPQKINVINTGKRRTKLIDGYHDIEKERAVGSATVVDQRYPGALKVQFGNMPEFFGSGPNYMILDTDYQSFALVYSCQQLGMLPFKIESAWILTRLRGKRPSNIDAIKDIMRGYGIQTRHFMSIDQNECDKKSNNNPMFPWMTG